MVSSREAVYMAAELTRQSRGNTEPRPRCGAFLPRNWNAADAASVSKLHKINAWGGYRIIDAGHDDWVRRSGSRWSPFDCHTHVSHNVLLRLCLISKMQLPTRWSTLDINSGNNDEPDSSRSA